MAESSRSGDQAPEIAARLANDSPQRVRLVTGNPHCRCARMPDHPCKAAITQEDLLCDTCRDGNCCVMNIGGAWLDSHQTAPVIDWEPAGDRNWGNHTAPVSFTLPLDSPNARIALGGDHDG